MFPITNVGGHKGWNKGSVMFAHVSDDVGGVEIEQFFFSKTRGNPIIVRNY